MRIKVTGRTKTHRGIVKVKESIKFDNLGAVLTRKKVIYFL